MIVAIPMIPTASGIMIRNFDFLIQEKAIVSSKSISGTALTGP